MGKTSAFECNFFPSTGSAFPDVAAAVEMELEEYKKADAQIKGLKNDIPDDESIDLLSDNTAKLASAITSLPELSKKKHEIDKHMSIAMGGFMSVYFLLVIQVLYTLVTCSHFTTGSTGAGIFFFLHSVNWLL